MEAGAAIHDDVIDDEAAWFAASPAAESEMVYALNARGDGGGSGEAASVDLEFVSACEPVEDEVNVVGVEVGDEVANTCVEFVGAGIVLHEATDEI